MKKIDFYRAIIENCKEVYGVKFTQDEIDVIYKAMGDVVIEAIKAGKTVEVVKGLKVETVEIPEREARNPKTGEPVVVPAHMRAKAKFTPKFKDAIK